MTRFSDKVALVTGVSDRGIGGAVVERLAREGAAVAVLWMDPPKRTLKALGRREVPHVSARCDVTDNDSVAAAVDACMAEFGQIDVVVNNAGVDFAGPLEQTDDRLWDQLMAVNLGGLMRVTRAALPYLAEPGGVVVSIGSVLGLAGCPGFTAYSASKAGACGLTQSLAAELAPSGRRAVCVAPALVHTPMAHKHVATAGPAERDAIDAAHPLGVGMPGDVAAAVAFLASDEARWITGITLPLGYHESFPLPSEAVERTTHNSTSASTAAEPPPGGADRGRRAGEREGELEEMHPSGSRA